MIAARFSPGTSTTSYVETGENQSVPITTELPGAWEMRLNCNVLGRQELTVDSKPTVGQRILARYTVGRFSGSIYIGDYLASRR